MYTQNTHWSPKAGVATLQFSASPRLVDLYTFAWLTGRRRFSQTHQQTLCVVVLWSLLRSFVVFFSSSFLVGKVANIDIILWLVYSMINARCVIIDAYFRTCCVAISVCVLRQSEINRRPFVRICLMEMCECLESSSHNDDFVGSNFFMYKLGRSISDAIYFWRTDAVLRCNSLIWAIWTLTPFYYIWVIHYIRFPFSTHFKDLL